jgi:hypothetical protein
MNIVPNPVIRWSPLGGGIKIGLKTHQSGSEFLGQPIHHFAPFLDVFVDGAFGF